MISPNAIGGMPVAKKEPMANPMASPRAVSGSRPNAIGPTMPNAVSQIPSFDTGGKVAKTGLAMVHKGEEVKPKDNMEHNVSLYRAMHHLKSGGLHRALGISPDKDIPKERVEAATHSSNSHVAHMARFAQTMGKFKH